MASTLFSLSAGVFTPLQDPDTDEAYTDGSIYHKSGGTVIYLEASSAPTEYNSDTPVMMKTVVGSDPESFNSVASTDILYAYAINEDAKITVSPSGS